MLREVARLEPGAETGGRSVFFRQAVGIAADLLDAAASPPQLIRDRTLVCSEEQFRVQFETAASRLRALKSFLDSRGLSPALIRETDDARLLHAATACDPLTLLRETVPGREARRVTPEWRLRLRNHAVSTFDLFGQASSGPPRPTCELIENPTRWIRGGREGAEASGQQIDAQLLRVFESSQLPPETARAVRATIFRMRSQPEPEERRQRAAADLRTALIRMCERFERGDAWEAGSVAVVTDSFATADESSLTVECLTRGLERAAASSEHQFAGILEAVALSPEWRFRTAHGVRPTPLESELFAKAATERFCELAFEPLVAPIIALQVVHPERIHEHINQRLAGAPLPCDEIRLAASAGLSFSRDLAHAMLLPALTTAVDLLHQAAKIGWIELARRDIPARTRVKRLRKRTERLCDAAAAHLVAASRRRETTPEAAVSRVREMAMLLSGTGASAHSPSDTAEFQQIRLQLA